MSTGMICPKCNERFGSHLFECPKDHTPLADARVADALVGRALGNFQVERILGAGGMGMIFSARHKTIGTQAVVKVLSPEMLRIRDAKVRFLNEAKLASAINHPNIVRIFDFGETPDEFVYMIMEYLPGDDLDGLLKGEKRIEPLRAAKIMRQVSSALDAAHGAPNGPVIHRDLKPANIRIARRGRDEHATVLDFGIAKAMEQPGHERLTQQGMVIGTPRYMAPEQACGDPVDARTDVYALGVIAYELVSGHTPYQTSRLVELVNRQLHMPVPGFKPDLEVPSAYQEIALRCLSLEPQKRFQTAGELCEAWEKFIEQAAAAQVRRKAGLAIAAALALGLAGAAAVFFIRGPGETRARVLELASLSVDGKDFLSAPTIYVRGERVKVEGAIGGLGPIAALAPEVRVSVDGKPVESEPRADGFAALVGPLAPGKKAKVEVAVEWGEKGKRQRTSLLDRAIVRDVTPPKLALRVPPDAPFRRAGDVYLFREPQQTVDVLIDEASFLPASSVTLKADRPVKATVTAIAGSSAKVAFDFSEARSNAASLVHIRVLDAAENEANLRFTAVYDPQPPELTVAPIEDSPGAPLPRTIKVTAKARDPSGMQDVALDVLDQPAKDSAQVTGVDKVADWATTTFAVSLREEGGYLLRVRATDRAGNATETALTIKTDVPLEVKDLAPIVTSAEDVVLKAATNKPLRSVEATREAAGAPSLSLVGKVEGNRYSLAVPLAKNTAQTIRIRLTPERGEPVEQRLSVIHDDVPPRIDIPKPAPWPDLISKAALQDGAIVFEWRVEDALSKVSGARVRAFGYKAEPPASWAGPGVPPGGIELPVQMQDSGGVARVRPSDALWVLVEVEAGDEAGNVGRVHKRSRVESTAPVVKAVPAHGRVRLHERIEIAIDTGKPVREVKVNGGAAGLKKTGDKTYVYEAAMFLDSPEGYAVEATDDAGNTGRSETRVVRENLCKTETAEEPVAIDPDAAWKNFREHKARGCPECPRDIFSEGAK